MGSYISIYNNTRDSYLVKVGPDEAAIKIATITVSVFASIATVVATAGALSAALVAKGVVDVMFVSTEALAAFTAAAARISLASAITGWASDAVLLITDKLQSECGYVEIKPGERRKFGKYTLSLWRQATCVRVRVNPKNPEEVVMDTLFMRPIFTGPTDGSSQEHNIQYWIDKRGHEDEHIVRLSPESRRMFGIK